MSRLRVSLGSLLLLCVASAAPAARYVRPGVDADVAGAYRADRVTVRLRPPAVAAARAAVARAPRGAARPRLAALGLPALDGAAAAAGVLAFAPEFPPEPPAAGGHADFGAFFYAELAPGTDVDAALAALRSSPDVASATPIGLVRTTLVPNDSLYAQQWSMRGSPGIDAERAWDVCAGDSTIPIAILDTGLLAWHPDFAGTTGGTGQFWTNAAEAAGLPGVDDDANGYVDDVHGWDFVDLPGVSGVWNGEDWDEEDPDPNDFAGHGTLVAGQAAALTNNGIGIAGAAWGSRIVPLRIGWSAIGASTGVIDMSFAALAIRYATRTGLRIVNCSFQSVYDPALFAAVDEATRAGVLVVNAAGNFGQPCDFPGSDCHELADREDVLGIGALAASGAISSVSETGDYVDVYAPGEDLPSTVTYHFSGDSVTSRVASYAIGASGTSLAAPIASGVAAMLLADRAHKGAPPLRPMELLFRIAESGTNVAGPRQLDAYTALTDTNASFAVRGGARATGSPVGITTTGRLHRVVVATTDDALVWLSARGDTLRRVVLDAGVVGSPAAAALANGEPGVFVALDDGRVMGFDARGDVLPGWPRLIDPNDGLPGAGPSLGDVDGDGAADVVSPVDGGAVYAWHADGGAPLAAFPLATDGAPAGTAALADLDGVPGAEVIVTTQSGRAHALRDSAAAPVVMGWPRTLSAAPRAPVVARFGATPVPRVVVAFGASLRAYTPAGAALWTRPLGGTVAADPALGDVDGDGVDDIVVPLADPDGLAAFDTTGTPLPGWPVVLTAPVTGPAIVRANAGGGAGIVFVPAAGRLFAFTGGGARIEGWPKAGRAGDGSTLFELGDGTDERIVAGAAVDSLLYYYTLPRWRPPSDGTRSWATARGGPARSASRFDIPAAGEFANVPDRVHDLAVEATSATSITLGWTATGDDGSRGRPRDYVVTWSGRDESLHLTIVPATVDAGGHESVVIGGLEPGMPYQFSIAARDDEGDVSAPSDDVFATTTAVSLAPFVRALAQPTRLPVTLEWRALGVPGQRILVYDVTGRLRRELDVGAATSGSVTWDGRDRSGHVAEPGLYFARLRGGDVHDPTARIVVVQ